MRYRPPNPSTLVIERHEGWLEARDAEDEPGTGVQVHWTTGAVGSRSAPRSRSPLLRAIGDAKSVIDATGGFGVDAWTIACAERRVLLVERSPVMSALLVDAHARALLEYPQVASRVTVVAGDARALLSRLAESTDTGEHPDAIYLDPMFPPKRRMSALPSKEMQFLAAVVGADEDAAALLEVARRVARDRVVVKRPPHASPLAPGSTFCIESKLLRFDVYFVASRGKDST